MSTTNKLAYFLITNLLLILLVLFVEKLIELIFQSGFISIVIAAPFVEESAKTGIFLFLSKKLLTQKTSRNYSKLILLIGFTFGLIENLFYFSFAYNAIPEYHFVQRIITAQIFHTVFPLFFLLPYLQNRKISAIAFPVVLHMIWNTFIYFELNYFFIYLFCLILFVFTIYKLLRINLWHISE